MSDEDIPDEEIPEITDQMIEEVRRMTGRWTMPLSDRPIWCPICEKESAITSHDLTYHEALPGVLLVVGGLSGMKCPDCGNMWIDTRSTALVDQYRRTPPPANYEASVSRVGGSGIGVYFPKDLQRVMGIRTGQRARMTPLDENAMLVELVDRDAKEPRRPRRRPRKASDATRHA